jgi:hypothetical protein
MKVIFVAGLSHSGTTLLDLTLSRHRHIVGFGEIYSVLTEKKDAWEKTELSCSCGLRRTECPVWSRYTAIAASERESVSEKYRRFFRLAADLGHNTIVDSSKQAEALQALKPLRDSGEIDLRTVFLIRDVRGWALTLENHPRRARVVPRPVGWFYWHWLKDNRRLKRLLERDSIAFMRLGYEEFIFDQKKMLHKVLDFAGVPRDSFRLENPPNTHIAFGNRMKLEPSTWNDIRYDGRWMNRYGLNLSYVLLPPVHLWNVRNTYSNMSRLPLNPSPK